VTPEKYRYLKIQEMSQHRDFFRKEYFDYTMKHIKRSVLKEMSSRFSLAIEAISSWPVDYVVEFGTKLPPSDWGKNVDMMKRRVALVDVNDAIFIICLEALPA